MIERWNTIILMTLKDKWLIKGVNMNTNEEHHPYCISEKDDTKKSYNGCILCFILKEYDEWRSKQSEPEVNMNTNEEAYGGEQ